MRCADRLVRDTEAKVKALQTRRSGTRKPRRNLLWVRGAGPWAVDVDAGGGEGTERGPVTGAF